MDSARLTRLVEQALSPAVQVPLPLDADEVPVRLSTGEVERVFTDHVPGVRHFLFRQKAGQHSLKFLASAYQNGLRAFEGTTLHRHLKMLMRTIVHYGHERRPGCATYLTEVAEAFMDCQAIQARAIERVGLQVRGVTQDFRGLVTRLVGEYKSLAVRTLAAERLAQGLAMDYDSNPTHYENRLTADLGPRLGLNADDVRRAHLDAHAESRFKRLEDQEAEAAAARCRQLFDGEALLSAIVAEVNGLCAESAPESVPRQFLCWASAHLSARHALLDEETSTQLDVDRGLALAILEALFLGRPASEALETHHHGVLLRDVFRRPCEEAQRGAARSSMALPRLAPAVETRGPPPSGASRLLKVGPPAQNLRSFFCFGVVAALSFAAWRVRRQLFF